MPTVLIESFDATPLPLATNHSASPQKILFRIVIGALVLRLIVVLFVFRGITDPSGGHQEFGQEVGWIARSIALHHGFSSPFVPQTGPTAYLPPLYPYLLSVIFRAFGIYTAKSAFTILSLNSLFSALTCVPIYYMTRYTHSARVALFAAMAWAVYPFSIYFSAARVWEFSLTSLLFTTCFLLVQRLHWETRSMAWLAFGLLYGITILSNPAILPLLPFLLLLCLWKTHRNGGRWLRNGLVAVFGTLMVVSPWTIRTYRTLHVLCPVRDTLWGELWSGNNGDTSNPTLAWTHPASSAHEMDLYQTLGEIPYLAQKRALVVPYLTHHPVAFASLTLRRIFSYWTGFWSLDRSYVQAEPFQLPNVFFCTSISLLMCLGARRWWLANRETSFPYLILIGIFPITYYITHPLMDYRQPIEPEIVILVTIGILSLVRPEDLPQDSPERSHQPEMAAV
jgi:4-amino-4-deoxy-L-arabinose transferase-like glycosyltransferase